MVIGWCTSVRLELIMHPGWQTGRTRSETKDWLSGANESELLPVLLSHLRVSAIQIEPQRERRHCG
jgi:hypothetical protein